jgi:hypothetical protein
MQNILNIPTGGLTITGEYWPSLLLESKRREEKMTQGWVVYGGMRHAKPQREMFPRSYESKRYDGVVVVSYLFS